MEALPLTEDKDLLPEAPTPLLTSSNRYKRKPTSITSLKDHPHSKLHSQQKPALTSKNVSKLPKIRKRFNEETASCISARTKPSLSSALSRNFSSVPLQPELHHLRIAPLTSRVSSVVETAENNKNISPTVEQGKAEGIQIDKLTFNCNEQIIQESIEDSQSSDTGRLWIQL